MESELNMLETVLLAMTVSTAFAGVLVFFNWALRWLFSKKINGTKRNGSLS